MPIESAYYLKMMQIINFNNPIHTTVSRSSNNNNNTAYPKENQNVANYLIDSRKQSRMFSFILNDHASDEFRLTDRYCIENAFKKFQTKKAFKNRFNTQITLVNAL